MATSNSAWSAVRTTGIYCVPKGCPGSPQARNVMPFAFAAGAEAAGYRACLRCRPYRSSDPVGWLDGPELVCRAVRLIIDGALDDARSTTWRAPSALAGGTCGACSSTMWEPPPTRWPGRAGRTLPGGYSTTRT